MDWHSPSANPVFFKSTKEVHPVKKKPKLPKKSKMYFPPYQDPRPSAAVEEKGFEEVADDNILCEDMYEPNNETVEQDADQDIDTEQESNELIIIRDSCNVNIQTTDTQAAVNLQIALQLAIVLIIQISIADSAQAERVTNTLMQQLQVKQVNQQKILIENSRDVTIVTTDTDISANIQVLLQALVALVARIEVA
jgi:spore coat protein X